MTLNSLTDALWLVDLYSRPGHSIRDDRLKHVVWSVGVDYHPVTIIFCVAILRLRPAVVASLVRVHCLSQKGRRGCGGILRPYSSC